MNERHGHIRGKLRAGLALGLVIALAGLTGCIGAVKIVVSPATAIVELGETVAFTATTAAGAPIVGVSWAVSSGPGTIDATSGVYTAPSSGVTDVTLVTITATKGTAQGSATLTLKPPKTVSLVDGSGDTFGTNAYDLTDFRLSRSSTQLVLTLTFSAALTTGDLAPAGGTVQPGDLAGFIDLDTDASATTGAASANSTFCPSTPLSALGVEAFLSLFERTATGNFPLIDAATLTVVEEASVTVSGTQVQITLPLAASAGAHGVNAVLGDDVGPTDCIPDEGAGLITVADERPAPELTIVGDPHLDYLSSLGLSWQTPSGTF